MILLEKKIFPVSVVKVNYYQLWNLQMVEMLIVA